MDSPTVFAHTGPTTSDAEPARGNSRALDVRLSFELAPGAEPARVEEQALFFLALIPGVRGVTRSDRVAPLNPAEEAAMHFSGEHFLRVRGELVRVTRQQWSMARTLRAAPAPIHSAKLLLALLKREDPATWGTGPGAGATVGSATAVYSALRRLFGRELRLGRQGYGFRSEASEPGRLGPLAFLASIALGGRQPSGQDATLLDVTNDRTV